MGGGFLCASGSWALTSGKKKVRMELAQTDGQGTPSIRSLFFYSLFLLSFCLVKIEVKLVYDVVFQVYSNVIQL